MKHSTRHTHWHIASLQSTPLQGFGKICPIIFDKCLKNIKQTDLLIMGIKRDLLNRLKVINDKNWSTYSQQNIACYWFLEMWLIELFVNGLITLQPFI
jgi:hypothetical protein